MEHKPLPITGTNIEALAAQLDRALVKLDMTEQRFAQRRITPGEVAFRDPAGSYHQITIGAVLTAYDLSAHDARALDGLLSLPVSKVEELIANLRRQRADEPDPAQGETVASILQTILCLWSSELEQEGRYAEWRRSFDRYMAATEPFLAELTEEALERLAQQPPTRKQVNLIRLTCDQFRLEFPALLNRAEAFGWLRDAGANARFREVV